MFETAWQCGNLIPVGYRTVDTILFADFEHFQPQIIKKRERSSFSLDC